MAINGRSVQSIALAAIVALALAAAALAEEQPGAKAACLRIIVSEKSVIYLQVQGLELRAAMSVEGLQSAEPMKMRLFGGTAAQARVFSLPIPADQLPAGVTAIKLGLWLGQAPPSPKSLPGLYFTGKLTQCRTDAQKAEWQYVTSIASIAGSDAEKAPAIQLPSLAGLKLTVTAEPSKGNVGVGLALSAGTATLPEIRRDGKPVQASVSVSNAAGKIIAEKTGTLTDFGFS